MWKWTGSCLAAVVATAVWMYISRRKTSQLERLKGKVVMITGASSGLGEALSVVLYRLGCKLILCARRRSELERVKEQLMQMKVATTTSEPQVVILDLSEFNSITKVAESCVALHGRIDILINNAGIGSRGKIMETSNDVDISVMNVNYFGQVFLTKAVLPHMIAQKSGHIVAVSSIQGKFAIPNRSAYGASKHALQSFFDCLRAELHSDNIDVTVVSPSYIKTNISLNAMTNTGEKNAVMESTIAKGMNAMYAADVIAESIALRKTDVLIGPFHHKLMVYLRNIWPSLYVRIMNSRLSHN